MLHIIAIMLAGVATGFLLRNRNLRLVPRLITVAIWLLLFLLGTEVGRNRTILDNLPAIGGQAVVLTMGGLAGTLLCAWWVWRRFFMDKD
ncbi:MAG: LysO family transporter [Bacteroidaceae bacterium]|nr:LysO family transporter [Bacteroidaceae bacterium]